MEKINISAIKHLLKDKNSKPTPTELTKPYYTDDKSRPNGIYIQDEHIGGAVKGVVGDVVRVIQGDVTYEIVESPSKIPVNVITKDGKIISITRLQPNEKHTEFKYSSYYLNGKLKNLIKFSTYAYFNEYLFNKAQLFDEQSNIIYEIDFKTEYKFNVDDILKYFESNIKEGKLQSISMLYYSAIFDEFIYPYWMYTITSETKENHPYWSVSYEIPAAKSYRTICTLIIDGKTGTVYNREDFTWTSRY